jgi:rhodanese-related sulfurtransferase
MRGYIAARILLQKGFDVANLGGGYKTSMLLRSARGLG